jgi:DHA3 family tetracycline resistance protein-like MFS transporter
MRKSAEHLMDSVIPDSPSARADRHADPRRVVRRPPLGLARVRMLAPLRNRNFALLWAGMTVSLLGDGIYFVAIAWEALRLSNTAMAISFVGIAWTLPTVAFLLFGGALSDRIDRRRVMLWASVAQAGAIGGIGLLVTFGANQLWAMLLLVALYGSADAFFLPAFEAIVPTILEPDEMAAASALDQFIRPLSLQLAGPAIGGVIVALTGTGAALLLDGATFLFAACTLVAMRTPRHCPAGDGRQRGPFTGVGEAIRFVRANAWLWRTLVAAGLTMLLFFGPSQVLLPYVVKNVLHAGSGTLGAVRACGGIGAIIAAISVSQRGLPGWPVRAMLAGWALQCLTLVGYAVASSSWLFGTIALLGGAFGAAGSVVWGTLMKTRVPNDVLGRVASLDLLVSIGLVPVSFAITGPVAQAIGAQATLLGGGALAAATMLVFALLAPSEERAPRSPNSYSAARSRLWSRWRRTRAVASGMSSVSAISALDQS